MDLKIQLYTAEGGWVDFMVRANSAGDMRAGWCQDLDSLSAGTKYRFVSGINYSVAYEIE